MPDGLYSRHEILGDLQRTSDFAWRSGAERAVRMREPIAPDLADLGVRGLIAGSAHPLAARRFQRATRSGGATESHDGQFAVTLDALDAGLHFPRQSLGPRCSGQATSHGNQEPNGRRR